jgi:hypothetical protein
MSGHLVRSAVLSVLLIGVTTLLTLAGCGDRLVDTDEFQIKLAVYREMIFVDAWAHH